jgi:hypothetical protein
MNPDHQPHHQEDIEIRNLLIYNQIIVNHRVAMCGNWSNKPFEGMRVINNVSKYIKHIPSPHFCNRYECRVCRSRLIQIQKKHHYSHNIEFINRGGKLLLFTLTVPHSVKDTLSSIYKRFKKSLELFKRSRGWKKIKKITQGQYHYDSIEITNTNGSVHLHDHISYGIMNTDVSLSTIEDILFDTWSYNTLKVGFRKISRKGISVSIPQSLTYGDKTVEELSKIKGTLEYLEREYKETYNHPSLQFREKKLKDIGVEIMNINKTFKGSKRGRIWKYVN